MKYLYALTMALVFRNWISLLSKPEKAIGNEGGSNHYHLHAKQCVIRIMRWVLVTKL